MNKYYHSLGEKPVFRFDLTDMKGIEITRMRIVEADYLSQIRCSLLNAETGRWEETGLNADVSDPAKYLDAEGMLYCRLEQGDGPDSDMTVPAPGLQLEGRVPNAEN